MSCVSKPNRISHKPNTSGWGLWPKAANKATALAELVNEYRHQEQGNDEISLFASMPSIEYAVERAGMAENDEGKRYSRQHRLKRQDLKAGTDKLRSRMPEIKACKSFSELHEIVCSITESTNGLGPLYAYDTAVRLGANLGIVTDRIYLHAGARAGAKALGLNYWQDFLPVSDFPAAVRAIAPYRIESFLCMYKDTLAKLAASPMYSPN